MTRRSLLVGFIRRKRIYDGCGEVKTGIVITLDAGMFSRAGTYKRGDADYVSLLVNEAKLTEILEGTREVTSVVHIVDGDEYEETKGGEEDGKSENDKV